MADLLFVVIVVAFFAITVAYVKACDHIIGPDLDLTSVPDTPSEGADSPDQPATATSGGRPTTVDLETTQGAW